MATGFWPSVSGAAARSQAVDTVANNLANVGTQGFKKDEPSFREYVARHEVEDLPGSVPRIPIKNRDLYPLDGKESSHVVVSGTHTNFRQGPIQVTHGPLDLAIDGPGFFEVSTPEGVRYTRQGSFKLAKDGRLVTSEGFPVLASQPGGLASALPATAVQPSQGGPLTQGGVAAGQGQALEPAPEVAARFINLGDVKGSISITESGELYGGPDLIASLSVAQFGQTGKLKKRGMNVFENTDPLANPAQPSDVSRTRVRQGMLEGSNVNPAEEMTNLIKANRMYEADLRTIKVFDQMMEKEANEIGKAF